MGKNQKKKPTSMINGKYYPFVSICTPTFNRRPFILNMFECYKNQTYPKHRMEWIIVDDGTDKVRDLIEASGIEQIKYYELPNKLPLGEKRNYMHTHAKGSIIVYMDDDDYYPPDRVSHAVDRLTENKDALCAGSSELYIYFKDLKRMVQYGPRHATAGTFAFRAELLKQTTYDNHAELAEEKSFLKNYTIPFVQLDPMKSILVFSHRHNTFDKRKMLDNPHPDYLKDSTKKVEDFIKLPHEANIKKFFMNDIDHLLANYKPGDPINKPKVLEQIRVIDKQRAEMQQQANAGQQKVMMNRPGQPPVELTVPDMVKLLQDQHQHMESLVARIKEQDDIIKNLQQTIVDMKKVNPVNTHVTSVFTNIPPKSDSLSKSQPEIVVNLSD